MLCSVLVPVLLILAGCAPLTNENGDKTRCETTGPVEEGKTASLQFFLSRDPVKSDMGFVNVIRGKYKVKVFELSYDKGADKLIPTLVEPGFEYAGMVGKNLTLVIKKARGHMTDVYHVEDTYANQPPQWKTCFLTVTGDSADERMEDMKQRLTALEANQRTLQERLHGVERKHDHGIMNMTQLSQAEYWDHLWPFIVTWLMMVVSFVSLFVNGNQWIKSKLSNCFKKKGNPADNKDEEQVPLNVSSQTNERLEERDNSTQRVETICQNHMKNPADTKHEELKQQNDDLICLVKQLLERIPRPEKGDKSRQAANPTLQIDQTENPADKEDEEQGLLNDSSDTNGEGQYHGTSEGQNLQTRPEKGDKSRQAANPTLQIDQHTENPADKEDEERGVLNGPSETNGEGQYHGMSEGQKLLTRNQRPEEAKYSQTTNDGADDKALNLQRESDEADDKELNHQSAASTQAPPRRSLRQKGQPRQAEAKL